MSLSKVIYTDGETIIHATNLNDIQDEIIITQNTLASKQNISTLETDVKAFINADYIKSLIDDGDEVSY